MKRFVIAAILLACTAFIVHAREVNNGTLDNLGTPDAWCVAGGAGYQATAVTGGISGGVNGAEDCVDFNGNFLPTVTNAQSLGTPSLVWSNIYSTNLTTTGSQFAGAVGTANVTGTGNASAPSPDTAVGTQVFQEAAVGGPTESTAFSIFASTTIPVISSFETLLSTGSVLVTSTPSISTRAVAGTGAILPGGTVLVLASTTTYTIVLQDQGTLAGSQLALGAATRTISKTKTLTLIWESVLARWEEIAYGNNQGN
jgi:hypothetical protein